MGLLSRVEAFCVRNFSSDYRNEAVKLGKMTFRQLAKEVEVQKESRAALLAIQDFAYQTCETRINSIKDGGKIRLLDGEKPVGAENCILGKAECMKEIYIQAKNLRHGNPPGSKTEKFFFFFERESSTFHQLNELGRLWGKEDILVSKDEFISLSNPIRRAIYHRFQVKLENWIEQRSEELHSQQKTIADDLLINQAKSLVKPFQPDYSRTERYEKDWTSGLDEPGDVTFTFSPSYENLDAVYSFLKENTAS